MIAHELETPTLKPQEFERISEFAYRRFGLSLRDGKQSLVSSRLAKLIRNGGFRSFHAYLEHVLEDRSGEAAVAMIDCLTTNHTSFLREPDHFEALRRAVLPQIRTRPVLKVWSAACSTGEEPYSILFTLLAALGTAREPRVEILASDISTRVLATARRAVYPPDRLGSVPPEWLKQYFTRTTEMGQPVFKVLPEYAGRVRFERRNLMEPFPTGESFPVIFCRNVMIYFDRETRERLVSRLAERLEPGGYLFVGHAESLIGISHGLTYVRPALYRRPRESRP